MPGLRLTQRQWRIYLTVWLVALAALTGTLIGVLVPRLLVRPQTAGLAGGVVFKAQSVPAPDFQLLDQRGATVSLAALRGRVVALTFLDTQCLDLCPLQASLLGTVQGALGPHAAFSVVVVSVKPEADTPASIGTFAASHGLGANLYWLNGSRPQLSAVWSSYGVGVQVANGDLTHSSVIYLIDRHGFERVAFADLPQSAWVESDVRLLEAS